MIDAEEKLRIFGKLQNLKVQVQSAIDDIKELWWQPCEYEASRSLLTYFQKDKEPPVNSLTDDGLVKPGAEASFLFGIEYPALDRDVGVLDGALGVKDTCFGFRSLVDIQKLVVDDESAPHFALKMFLVGKRSLWNYGKEVDASRFSASVDPAIAVNTYVAHGAQVQICVRNKTDVPRKFVAKIVGREQTP